MSYTNQESIEARVMRELARRSSAEDALDCIVVKFSDAVRTLCLNQGNVKDGLRMAFGSLSLAGMAAASLPDDLVQPDLKQRVNEIIESMTNKPDSVRAPSAVPPRASLWPRRSPGYRLGTLYTTLIGMQFKTASPIAKNIWELHDCLQAGCWRLKPAG